MSANVNLGFNPASFARQQPAQQAAQKNPANNRTAAMGIVNQVGGFEKASDAQKRRRAVQLTQKGRQKALDIKAKGVEGKMRAK